MAKPPDYAALALLQDEKARRVIEYLIERLTASALKLSYDLRMPPDELEAVLTLLEGPGLVRRAPRQSQMPGDAIQVTEKGQQLRQYVGRTARQNKL